MVVYESEARRRFIASSLSSSTTKSKQPAASLEGGGVGAGATAAAAGMKCGIDVAGETIAEDSPSAYVALLHVDDAEAREAAKIRAFPAAVINQVCGCDCWW